MKKGPCYECEDRVIGCHSNCEKYIDWIKERKVLNERIAKERNVNVLVTGHVVRTIKRNKRHRNR